MRWNERCHRLTYVYLLTKNVPKICIASPLYAVLINAYVNYYHSSLSFDDGSLRDSNEENWCSNRVSINAFHPCLGDFIKHIRTKPKEICFRCIHMMQMWSGSSRALYHHKVGFQLRAKCGCVMLHNGAHYEMYGAHPVNVLKLRQNGRLSVDDISTCICLDENEWISINISIKFVHKQINNIPALV